MTRLAISVSSVIFGMLLMGDISTESEAIVTDRVLTPSVGRFGLNLGGWSFWGPDQFSSNILKNPGFEGLLDGAIVIPAHSGTNIFDDSPAWLARPTGFWDGARFSIRSGSNAGRQGVISQSSQSNEWGLPAFTIRGGDPVPQPGDAVAVVKDNENALPSQWWYSKEPGNSFRPELTDRRPGSPGTRSLRIGASGVSPATLSSYFDSMGGRAGKLLPLDGSWNLSFWARADKGAANLRVSFERQGSAPVLSRDVPLSPSWTNVRLNFTANDSGPPGTAALRFQVTGNPAGEVLLDDADLRRTEDVGQPFRREVVSMIERLHPAYLREWQGQLADTLANRTASQFARKSYRYRPGDNHPGDAAQTDFGYSLPDFLDLCVRVKAAPWIIVPPVFNDEDCAGLGTYLASREDLAAFPEILLEFGNENWNPLFRPAGIPDPAAHGEAAGRCFGAIRAHAHGTRLKTVINAQAGYPDGALQFARASKVSDIVAIAPYFLYSLPKDLSLKERIARMFERDAKTPAIATALPEMHKELAVYEMNLHTINGDASTEERKPVVAGMASGSALARNMLDTLALGVRRQCVYTLTGFDAQLTARPGTVPLWGIARDLGPTQRLRPTGLALQLMNEVLAGDMTQVRVRGAGVSVYAFRSVRGWSAVVISSSATERKVTVRFPPAAGGKGEDGVVRVRRLAAQTETSTNEEGEGVRITAETAPLLDSSVSFMLRPWSMAVVQPLFSR